LSWFAVETRRVAGQSVPVDEPAVQHGHASRVWALAATCAVAIVIAMTLAVSPYHVLSDGAIYTQAYEGMADLDLVNGFALYVGVVGSAEPVHFIIIWTSSKLGLPKDLVMAAANGVLAAIAIAVFRRWGARAWIAAAIVSTSFYFEELYFTTERLKFAFIFLGLSLLWIDRPKRFYAAAILAVFSHVQSLLVYGGIAVVWFVREARNWQLLKRNRLRSIAIVLAMAVPAAFLSEHILGKIEAYSVGASEEGWIEMIRNLAFLALALFYAKDRKQAFALFVPLIVVMATVGTLRVNMMGYYVFLYYGLQARGGANVGVTTTSAYFLWKGIGFLGNIIHEGYGFPDV
jgi:hypothetical protein